MAKEGDAAQAAAEAFIREVWGLQAGGYVVLGLRYFTHFYFARPFAWDDFLMLLATVSFRALSDSKSEIEPCLHLVHLGRLHSRIGSRILRGGILERPREQWNDGRREGGSPADRP